MELESGLKKDGQMKRARFTEEQIIAVLREHEARSKTADLAHKHGISEATIYNWKAKFGGMDVSQARRLRAVEEENAKLKKLLAEQMLDAPDLLAEPSVAAAAPVEPDGTEPNGRKPRNGSVDRPRQSKPLLATGPSAILREQLVAEIRDLTDEETHALWAHRRLPAKNSLTTDDAHTVEAAYQAALGAIARDVESELGQAPSFDPGPTSPEQAFAVVDSPVAEGQQSSIADMVTPLRNTVRRRNHLAFVCRPTMPGLPAVTWRCASSEICPTPSSRTQGQRRVHRACVGIIIGSCIVMATKPHGGPTFRSRP
jgi:putative transposase